MEVSLKTVFARADRSHIRAASQRRAGPACEVLEERQLLSLAGGNLAAYHDRGALMNGRVNTGSRHGVREFRSLGDNGQTSSGVLQGSVFGGSVTPSAVPAVAGGTAITPDVPSAGTPTPTPVPTQAQAQVLTPTTTNGSSTTSASTSMPTTGTATPAAPQESAGALLMSGLLGGTQESLALVLGPPGGFGSLFGSDTPSQTTTTSSSSTTTTTTPSSSTSTPSSGTTTTTSSLQSDFQQLRTDLQTIHDKSQVTPALLAAVRNDFQTIQSDATTSADQTKLQTLATDVKNLNGTLPTADQTTQLETDFTAVLNSEGVTDQTVISQAISDIQAVVTATNITADDLSTLAADQQAIQKDMPAAPSGSTQGAVGSPMPFDPSGGGFGNGPTFLSSGSGMGNGPMMTASGGGMANGAMSFPTGGGFGNGPTFLSSDSGMGNGPMMTTSGGGMANGAVSFPSGGGFSNAPTMSPLGSGGQIGSVAGSFNLGSGEQGGPGGPMFASQGNFAGGGSGGAPMGGMSQMNVGGFFANGGNQTFAVSSGNGPSGKPTA